MRNLSVDTNKRNHIITFVSSELLLLGNVSLTAPFIEPWLFVDMIGRFTPPMELSVHTLLLHSSDDLDTLVDR